MKKRITDNHRMAFLELFGEVDFRNDYSEDGLMELWIAYGNINDREAVLLGSGTNKRRAIDAAMINYKKDEFKWLRK